VNLKIINSDFLKFFPEGVTPLPPVTHINLDPSCSGSGMGGPATTDKKRLQTLSNFQQKMLKHAQHAFPSVGTICYSTCSLNEIENESVVTSVVDEFRFEIAKQPLPAPWWSMDNDDGWVRITPEKNNCRGFFLAKLVRK
jgi:putative methyltransferase